MNNEYRSQAARGEASRRKYVGQSGRGEGVGNRVGGQPLVPHPTPSPYSLTLSSYPWSLRLFMAVALVGALAIGLRVTGILALPVDPPVGAEATHAAFTNVLSGRVSGSLDPVRYFPPPAAWYGQAPALPDAGLPLFGWLVASGMQLTGAGDWLGRAVSVLFSLLAGLLLFGIVRRTAGARAGLYALLFFSISPLSVVLGQQFSPDMAMLAAQALAMLGDNESAFDAHRQVLALATSRTTLGEQLFRLAQASRDLGKRDAAVQALNSGDPALTDTITVQTSDGTTQDIVISINGANDAAVITGDASGSLGDLVTTFTTDPALRPYSAV